MYFIPLIAEQLVNDYVFFINITRIMLGKKAVYRTRLLVEIRAVQVRLKLLITRVQMTCQAIFPMGVKDTSTTKDKITED